MAFREVGGGEPLALRSVHGASSSGRARTGRRRGPARRDPDRRRPTRADRPRRGPGRRDPTRYRPSTPIARSRIRPRGAGPPPRPRARSVRRAARCPTSGRRSGCRTGRSTTARCRRAGAGPDRRARSRASSRAAVGFSTGPSCRGTFTASSLRPSGPPAYRIGVVSTHCHRSPVEGFVRPRADRGRRAPVPHGRWPTVSPRPRAPPSEPPRSSPSPADRAGRRGVRPRRHADPAGRPRRGRRAAG